MCCVPYGPLTDVPYFRIKLKVLPVLCNLSRSVAPGLPDLPGPGTQVLVEVHRRSLLPPPPPRRLLVSKNLGSHLVAPRTGTRDEHVNLVAPIPSDARRICLRVHASRSSTLSRTPTSSASHHYSSAPKHIPYLPTYSVRGSHMRIVSPGSRCASWRYWCFHSRPKTATPCASGWSPSFAVPSCWVAVPWGTND